ncbi:hypothetical protein T265_05311 [Opisthorchis viverrini]|uniref:Uncharacterized protein n=1 Tax=Opisthorchis viverrini TaxID=6198 RepID=A0A075AFF8_OPIVI|nr:hypothetical protein T265_05311 [Opisthorchis viverrini]KER27679.1 hypothetical protein T265_05311 [Opisthorchis viverrini]
MVVSVPTQIHWARWLKWLESEFSDRKSSCNLRVAWQLGIERVLQLNDSNKPCLASMWLAQNGHKLASTTTSRRVEAYDFIDLICPTFL